MDKEKIVDDVRKYGVRKARYDLQTESGYDETHSVFVYEYAGNDVVLVMCRGQYIEYFITKKGVI